jgi:hypothetical protein
MSNVIVCCLKYFLVSQSVLLHAAFMYDLDHDDGSGFCLVKSAGMSPLGKLQMRIPSLVHSIAKTPPPAALNDSPYEVWEASMNAQPLLSTEEEAQVV